MRVVAENGVTSFCAPPTVYRYLIKEDLTRYDLSKLEYCVVAGEPLNPEVYNQFFKMTGLKLMEGYGQTESVVMVATSSLDGTETGFYGQAFPRFCHGHCG